ncbi:MAG: xylulokinase [Chloroflexota bacterium]
MAALLGIDLGTSAVKAVVIDEQGQLLGVGSREIPMEMPAPGRAEQDPYGWWTSTVLAVREALRATQVDDIAGIGLDGHMHVGPLLDADLRPLGKAITWADQRSSELIPEIEAEVGRDRFLSISGTRPAAGFMAPTLAWLARHEPERLDAAAIFLMPKDYLRLRLTGEAATDISDASATALFDITARTWSLELCTLLGVPERILPPLLESADIAGRLTNTAAVELGLRSGIPVVAGTADQPAQAVANGLLDPGTGSVTLGSGSQVFCTTDGPAFDPEGRVHTFCHAAPGRWYRLGATLAAGLSLRWLRDILALPASDPYAQLDRLAAEVEPGADGLTFVPYLVGERSPIMAPLAQGSFVGLSLRHGQGHLARAVLEGVACSVRATRDAVTDAGVGPDAWLATGNGLASPLWRQILTDVFDEPLSYVAAPERSAVGSALIAGIGTGIYGSYEEAADAARHPLEPTEPDPLRARSYDDIYERYLRRSRALLDEQARSADRPTDRG